MTKSCCEMAGAQVVPSALPFEAGRRDECLLAQPLQALGSKSVIAKVSELIRVFCAEKILNFARSCQGVACK